MAIMARQPTAAEGPRRFPRLAGGRGPRLAIGVAVGLIACLGVTIWRMQSLDGLPDVGDPFDLAAARRPVEIPDADNAFVAYAAAQKLIGKPTAVDEARLDLLRDALQGDPIKPLAWSKVPRGVREYLEAKRPALEVWREGSRRRDALYHQPGRMSIDTVLDLVNDAIVFAGMAALEGSRLEDAGATQEAWDWYVAMLRSSRLIGRNGGLVQRVYGARVHLRAASSILRWAANPRVEREQLRRALRETLAADALTPPVSEAIKIDYIACTKIVDDMRNFEGTMRSFGRTLPLLGGRQQGMLDQFVPWGFIRSPVQRIRFNASNELERSRRVFRLVFANWLAQADRPAGARARLAIREPTWIYADDPSAPAAARALRPELLARAISQTEIAGFLFGLGPDRGDPPWDGQGELARERRNRSVLIVRLAAELYRREHGATPATAGALVGTVLEALPEGLNAGRSNPDRSGMRLGLNCLA